MHLCSKLNKIQQMIERDTELQITDETDIGFIPCYRLPFMNLIINLKISIK